jgi:hypothetical protein
MTGAQASLDQFRRDTPQAIIERVQRKARTALAGRSPPKIEVAE